MVERAGLIDFANGTNIPLAVNVYMLKMVAFKASLTITRVGTRKGGINGFTMDSTGGSDVVSEFGTLDSEFNCRRERGG